MLISIPTAKFFPGGDLPIENQEKKFWSPLSSGDDIA
jgi:hypothetical protein